MIVGLEAKNENWNVGDFLFADNPSGEPPTLKLDVFDKTFFILIIAIMLIASCTSITYNFISRAAQVGEDPSPFCGT